MTAALYPNPPIARPAMTPYTDWASAATKFPLPTIPIPRNTSKLGDRLRRNHPAGTLVRSRVTPNAALTHPICG